MIAVAQPAIAQTAENSATQIDVSVNGESVDGQEGTTSGTNSKIDVNVNIDGTTTTITDDSAAESQNGQNGKDGEGDTNAPDAKDDQNNGKNNTNATQVNVGEGLDVLGTVLGLIAIVAALAAGWLYFSAPALGIKLPF